MPEHFYLMILFLRESERQKNVSNVPGKTGKRRGRPPKRKKKKYRRRLYPGKKFHWSIFIDSLILEGTLVSPHLYYFYLCIERTQVIAYGNLSQSPHEIIKQPCLYDLYQVICLNLLIWMMVVRLMRIKLHRTVHGSTRR